MNWEAIGAIGEVAGALGVIATLAYLAVQIRQNSGHLAESAKLAEASLIETNASAIIEFRKMMLLNPDLLDLQARGFRSFASLDPKERLQFDLLLRIIMQQSETMYLRYLLFNHDPDEFAGTKSVLEKMVRLQGFREWFDHAETDWRPEFRELMQSAIERADSEKPP